jgi:DNA polymerase delta subunit 2
MNEPFVLQACPHIFFAGNQPQFGTAIVEREPTFRLNGTDAEMIDVADENYHTRVRLLLIPKFHETGELVLVDTETLDVELVRFGAFSGQEERK